MFGTKKIEIKIVGMELERFKNRNNSIEIRSIQEIENVINKAIAGSN